MALPNNPTANQVVKGIKDIEANKQDVLPTTSTAGQVLTSTATAGTMQWANVPQELFKCTYGTTTYAEITSALSAGKVPVCFYDNKQYVYVGLSSTNRYTFASQLFDTQRYISVNSSDSWGAGTNNFEVTSNKVTSLSSSSTNAQYPSAKLVYDQLELKQASLPTTTTAGKVLKSTSTAGTVEWGDVSGGSSTDVQIDGTSITSNSIANIITNSGDYNSSTNKLATMNDVSPMTFAKVYKSIAEVDSSLTTSSTVTNVVSAMADNSYLFAEIENYTNLIPDSTYLRGVFEVVKVKSKFASCKYISAINSMSSTGAMKIWVGEFNNVFGGWTGWKELAQSTSIPDVSGKENSSNKVTSLSSSSTDTEYPSAKCVYDLIGDVETLLSQI